MPPSDQHPTLAELRRFSTLRQLDRQALNQLADRLTIQHAARDVVLLELGSTDDHSLYLLKGRVRLTARDGKVKEIDQEDTSAQDPLARLRPATYEVRSLSPISYLRISNQLLDTVTRQRQGTSSLLDRSDP